MYYTVIKHDGRLRTRGKFLKYEPQASDVFISRVFSSVRSVLLQCNTAQASSFVLSYRFYTRKTIKHAFSMYYTLIKHRFFDQSERAQGPIYIIKLSRLFRFEDAFIDWILCCEHPSIKMA